MIVLVVLFSCVASVWSQDPLLVRWNNMLIVDYSTDLRQLIYHDEIVMTANPGIDGTGFLICRASPPTSAAGWRRPDDTAIATANTSNDFTQYMVSFSSSNTRVQLARGRDPLQDGASNNGLWTCHDGSNAPHHVAIYDRGNGQISVAVSLQSSSFGSDTFTLAADTTGGPPTTFSWRRNGGSALTNSSSYSISNPVANPDNNQEGRENCLYRSTLRVTGVFPGVYEYRATNRATTGDVTGSFTIEGGPPSNLMVVQTGLNMVEVSWDPPPFPPSRGYQVQYGHIIISTTNTSLAVMLSPGEHTFQVMSLSDHFDGIVGETITVRGTFTPSITLSELTATSVRVSWSSPPMFSFTVMRYEVTVRRVEACNSVEPRRGPRSQTSNDRTELFEDLQEYINYRAEVTVFYESSSSSFTVTRIQAEMEFTTLAIAPSEIPSNVISMTTSRTISVSWNAIDCANRNGPNFRYEVDFQLMNGEATFNETINGVTFMVEGLRPFTSYTFRVRGVNDAGNGGYTSLMTIRTNAEAPSEVPGNVMVVSVTSRSADVSWDAIDSSNQNGPNFHYEVDFQRIDGETVPVGTVNNEMFTVEGLQPFINYTFRVRGVNDAGSGNYTQPTVIQTGQEAPSEVPSNVVVVVTGRTMNVTWDVISPNGPNFGYDVEFQRIDGRNTPPGLVNEAIPSFFVEELQPFTNYTFQVRGVNDLGNGSFTELIVIQTIQEAPSEVPSNFVFMVTSRTITVSWDAINPNGPNFKYEVEFQQMGEQSTLEGTVDTVMRTFFVEGLQPFTNYTFRVRGVNDAGNGEYTDISVIQSEQEAPSEVPSNVVFNVTSRTVSVSWDPIERENQNGENFRYDLELVQMDLTTSNATTQNMFTYEGLRPFTNYTFRLRGVNDFGNGNYTNPFVIQTDEDIPGNVTDFEAQLSTFTSVLVTWSPPQEPNGIIIMYELTYLLNETMSTTKNITNRLSDTIESVVNTRIEVRVRAYTIVGPGPIVTTSITLSPPIVMNVQVISLSDTSVEVSWDRITDIPGITEYIVYYAPVSSSRKRQDIRNERSVRVPSTENSTEITGLESTVEYQYQVTAVAIFNGRQLEGDRSPITDNTRLMIAEPTTTSTTAESTNATSSRNTGIIVAIVIIILALVVIVVVVLVVVFVLRLSRRSSPSKYKASDRLMPSNVSAVGYSKSLGDSVNIHNSIEPRIDSFPDDTVAVEGESVVFKVVVSGKPVPTLTWYYDNVEVTTGYSQDILDDGSLSFPSAELKQSGVYKLLARNSAGSVQKEVKLTVRPEKDSIPDLGGSGKASTFEPVPVAKFGDYVAKNHGSNNQGFRDQFNALESGDHYAKTIGLSNECRKLNRFANITNYDHNRIVLKPLKGHTNDFINGCYIDGYSQPKKFIATQGPTPNTLIDFWRLVWQERPPTIVMVTNLKENNKTKCEQYWPESDSSTFGPFSVTLLEHQVFADYCIRTLQVSMEGGDLPHKLNQFHFTAWPDHGVPDYATPMLAFHRRIASAHNLRRGPMLVHCSAGVGRTGTFMCIDIVQEQIKSEQSVDIAGAINKMRHQRMKMVQTIEQYCFLHDAMLESVTCGDTQITAADLRMKIAKFQKADPSTGLTTFQSQFAVLEQVSPKTSEVICKVATQNLTRNRNTDYLPPDRYRVILKGEQPDYIHASFANGYKHQKAYMIAEGPMSSTTRNMMKLLYERRCGVIVMLSGLQENGRESCFQYWPAVGATATHGEYSVELTSEEALEGFTIRKLSITEQKSQKAHQVTQFHITCWSPDGQCSNLRSVVDMIDEMEKVQRRTGNKPVFVHCSDTVTRSGMFCAMATVIDRCKTEGVVDVFQVVKALRVQKPGAVPTVDNFKTIFDATLTFLDSFDTYANFQNV